MEILDLKTILSFLSSGVALAFSLGVSIHKLNNLSKRYERLEARVEKYEGENYKTLMEILRAVSTIQADIEWLKNSIK